MSWPTWSAAAAPIPTAVAATVPSTLLPTAINSAPTVLGPVGYSQDQWAQAQQQNWQQWAQWQQQYQQWHQQYGAEYQKSLNAMQGALPTPVQVQPPLPAASAAMAPPLPSENKPPLPPEEPSVQHTVGFNAVPPGYATATPAMIAQTPVQPLYRMQQPNWQTTAQKRPYTQGNDYNDPAKRLMVQKPPQTQWQGTMSNYHQPPPPTSTTQVPTQASVTQNLPPVQSTTPVKPNVEELSEAEKKFDKEFAAWEAQFNKWREQNANHPDKTQYKEYEKKWESWRNSLLERREQMRRKRLALCGQATTTATPQKSDNLQEISSNTSQPSSMAKPSLLGTYSGDKSAQHQANDLYKKIPPNQNNEPLTFKCKSPYQNIDNVTEKEGEGFLTSTSAAEGIPGLDLVKDDAKEDLPDRSEKPEREKASTPPKGPDFEAISKGINSILGDQKLLSMLSMVSQNAPIVTPSNSTTTDIAPNMSNYGQNYGVPPPNFHQYPPNYNAPPPIYEGQNTDYSSENMNKSNKDDYYQQRNDKFSGPPPDIRTSGPRISQDSFGRDIQNDLYGGAPPTAQDNYGPGSRHVQDNYGPGSRHVQDKFDYGARNVHNSFGGRNIQDKVGFGGRNEQENFGGRNLQDNIGSNGRNVPDNFGSNRNSGFDKGIDRFNRNDQFNEGFQGRNERFGNNDAFNNNQNNFTGRERFDNKYGRSGKFDDNNDYEDYDEYNEEEDYDKYNEMFRDDDNEHYNSNYQQRPQNTFNPLQQQPKIPSLLDITPEPPQRQPQPKIPSLMDITPEPPQICNDIPMVDDDIIFEPTTVIDYEHCSKTDLDHTVSIVPVHMYNYNHKPVNSVPHSERPKWLAESVKFIREFDPSVMRYERAPPIEDRYSAPIINEVPYISFERRDRYRERIIRRERSFDRDNTTSNDRKRYRSRERVRDDFGSRRKYTEDKFNDTSLIQNAEEISDSEIDFEQNEPSRLNKQMDSRRSRSPELSNPPNPSTRQEITMIEDIINPPGRYNRPPRIVIILRGPPGSGKTFLAKQIKDKEVENGGSAPRILSLDDYFMVEHEKQVVEDGKTQIVKEMVYEYEADMEESYRQSFMKSFKKTITDGYFTFIVVDNVNDKVKHFGEMWSFAKQNGFQVYVCQMDLDPIQCSKRNIHNRSEKEIEEIISAWEPTPSHHPTIDATGLLQSSSITEVEMEVEEEKHLEETKDPELSSMDSTSRFEGREPWKNTSKWNPNGNPRNLQNRGRRGSGGPIWRNKGTWKR